MDYSLHMVALAVKRRALKCGFVNLEKWPAGSKPTQQLGSLFGDENHHPTVWSILEADMFTNGYRLGAPSSKPIGLSTTRMTKVYKYGSPDALLDEEICVSLGEHLWLCFLFSVKKC